MEKEILQEGTGCYLKVTKTAGEERGDRLFSYQEIRGFLPLEVRRINGEKEYIYDISGKISLAEYLSQTAFNRSYICRLLGRLLEMIHTLEEYLLDGNGLVIQEDCLYVRRSTGEPEGMYQPGQQAEVVPAVGKLLEYIMEKMNPEDTALAFFVYDMHKLTKEPECTRGMLEEYLERSEGPETEALDDEPEREKPVRRGGGAAAPRRKKQRPHTEKKATPAEYLLPILFAAAGILIPLVLWRLGVFRKPLSGQMDWSRLAGAAALFAGTAGYGVWRTLPQRESDIWLEEDGFSQKSVCLISQRGIGEPIPVTEFPYWIGGEEGRADAVLRDEGVSCVHACLLQEDGEVMVMDEESENGTFCNGERLVPGQKKILRDGDILRFARLEYVVEIT